MNESADLSGFSLVNYAPERINCPKHGIHPHVIASTIPGHKGYWCQICWLETLGEPLQLLSQED